MKIVILGDPGTVSRVGRNSKQTESHRGRLPYEKDGNAPRPAYYKWQDAFISGGQSIFSGALEEKIIKKNAFISVFSLEPRPDWFSFGIHSNFSKSIPDCPPHPPGDWVSQEFSWDESKLRRFNCLILQLTLYHDMEDLSVDCKNQSLELHHSVFRNRQWEHLKLL